MSDGPSINIWSWVTGAIGLATVVPLLYAFVMAQIPRTKIKVLEDAIDDTRGLIDSVIEKGLLSDVTYIAKSKRTLASIEGQAIDFKLSAYSTKSFAQQIKGMVTGVSYGIYRLYQRVDKLRADVSETTSQARIRLEREGRAPLPSVDDATSTSASSCHSTQSASEMGRQSVDISDLSYPYVRTEELPIDDQSEFLATFQHEAAQRPPAVSGTSE